MIIFGILQIFWKHFEDSTLLGTLVKKLFQKITPKHVQNTFGQFGNDFGRFWNFESFLIFWKHFEYSTLHGALGKKKLPKKVPRNMFKTLLDNLGTILGVFAILNFFKFFKNISKTRPSLEHWAKKFSRKNYPKNMFKTRLDTFRNDFDHFWNFAKFLIFWNHFEDSTLHGTLRKKNFRKKYPKTCSKHFWTIWERLRAFLEFLKFFMNISKTRPSMDYCAKKFSKKLPQSMFKTRLDKLGTTVGVFWILKVF